MAFTRTLVRALLCAAVAQGSAHAQPSAPPSSGAPGSGTTIRDLLGSPSSSSAPGTSTSTGTGTGTTIQDLLGNGSGSSGSSGGAGAAASGGTCSAPTAGATCGGAGPASQGNTSGVNLGAGNPINLTHGNKFQTEVDLPALPGELGLEIVRHYNSSARHVVGQLGMGWRLSYETDLYVVGATVQILQADGARLMFNIDPARPSLCTGQNPAHGWVEIRPAAAGGSAQDKEYIWHWTHGEEAGRRLSFNAQGKLVQIVSASGAVLSITRGPRGELLQVTDPQGRRLILQHASAAQRQAATEANPVFAGIQHIDSPLGRFSYTHGSGQAQVGNLVRVHLPTRVEDTRRAHDWSNRRASTSSISRLYHYEDPRHPQALTGISVLGTGSDGQTLDQRLATYRYDERARAVFSARGAVDKPRGSTPTSDQQSTPATEQVQLQFLQPSTPTREGRTLLTNSLGQQTLYTHRIIGGEYRLTEALGAGCAACGPVNIRWRYDEQGRLVEQTTLGPVAVIDGQQQGAAQPLLTTRHTLDAQGRTVRIEQIAYANGKAQSAQSLQRHLYADTRWPGKPTLIVRPSVVAGQEQQIALRYNDAGQVTELKETGWSPLDAQGQVARSPTQASLLERTTTYTYERINGRSLLTQVDGPLPNGPTNSPADSDITTYQWDARGNRLRSVTHAMGLQETYGYDLESNNPTGRAIAYRGLDGVQTRLQYQADGQVKQVDQAGAVSQLSYSASGFLQQIVNPGGARLEMWRDTAGQITAVGDPQNNRIQLTRNTEGELQSAQLLHPDGSLAQRALAYTNPKEDAVLRGVRQLIDPTRAPHHDNLARPAPNPLARAALHNWAIDARSPAAARQDTQVAHDNLGRPTRYLQDDFGQLVQVSSPVTGVSQFQYDPAGRLVARWQADGSVARYIRDAAGRVTGVQSTDALGQTDEDAHITWGPSNKPAHISYRAGSERFTYDNAARLTEHHQTIDGKTFVLRHSYNAAGQRVAQQLPGGQQLAYRYRGHQHPRAGLLESIWLQSGPLGLMDRAVLQDMNGDGDRFDQRSFVFGNGLRNDRRLDDQGRVTLAGNAQVGQTRLSYAEDAASQLASAEASRWRSGQQEPSAVQAEQTIRLSQRAQAQAAQALWSRLRSQAAGWRSPLQEAGLLAPGTSSPPNDLLDARFDALGRQTSQGPTRYEYDSLGRLTRVTRVDSVTGQAEEVARYRYNLFGQRIAKAVATSGGPGGNTTQTTYFFHDGSQLVAEADASGEIGKQYIWLNDKPVGMLRGGQLLAIHTDHRNAPLAVTDEARCVIWQASNSDHLLARPAQPDEARLGTIALNLRGSNQYFDAETGLHYNTHRYFDPTARRYLTPDPLGLAAGPDLYAFALGQPHSFSDPLGLQPVSNAQVAQASYAQKLTWVLHAAGDSMGGEMRQALLDLVSPQNLAITTGVFAVWAASHAFGVGFIADAALLATAYVTMGAGAAQVIVGFVQAAIAINSATTCATIQSIGQQLARALSQGGVSVVSGAALGRLFRSTGEGLGQQAVQQLNQRTGNANTQQRINLAPPPVRTLNELVGNALTGRPVTNTARPGSAGNFQRGQLGEVVARDILRAQTGNDYVSIQNASRNGIDLVRINRETRTIEHIEVKCSGCQTPALPTWDPSEKFDRWIAGAIEGQLNGQAVSAADLRLATEIRRVMIEENFTLNNNVMQVLLPPTGAQGIPTAELRSWTGQGAFSPCMTSVCR